MFGAFLKPTARAQCYLEKQVMAAIQATTRQSRQAEFVKRLELELVYAEQKNWFVIFQSLTVRDEHQDKVFGKDATAFRYYVQNIERAIMRKECGTVKKGYEARKNGRQFHRYAAVLDRDWETPLRLFRRLYLGVRL